MGQLKGKSDFFRPGLPADKADPEILNFLVSHISGTVLDLGGGQGAYSKELVNRGFQVCLTDVNQEYLEAAKQAGIETIDPNLIDSQSLSKCYDTVILVEVLEHVENYRDLLRKASNLAKKKILITVPCNDKFKHLFQFGLTFAHIAVTDHINHFSSSDISSLLDGMKFKHEIHYGTYFFPDAGLVFLYSELKKTLISKICTLPLKIANRFHLIPKSIPMRIFTVVDLENSA